MIQIKSRAAADLIKRSYFRADYSKDWDKDPTLRRDYIAKPNAITAVVLAETEAHDRAVEAFKKACSCGVQAGIGPKCERFVNCGRYKCFINELNK